MGLFTLQAIFCASYPEDERTHALPAHVRRAARAIMQGRTAALGGHVQACPDGHVSRIWYHSCRHRSGPPCPSLQTERWLALQQARLLPWDHDHVIFTLPHALTPLWLAHVPAMSTLLLQAARATFIAWLADAKYLGAPPGIMAALHPWSQTLVRPPHGHCLVTGGGVPPAGPWVTGRRGFLVPVRGVMAVLRGKRLAAIRQAWAREPLTLPEGRRPHQWLHRLKRLGHPTTTPWNVWIMARYRHGAGVVTSLARSLRGGPSKNARRVAWDGSYVTVTYRTRHEETEAGPPSPQRMPWPVADFLQRWRLHGPAPQTRVVRC
jgi:hypothetical protein